MTTSDEVHDSNDTTYRTMLAAAETGTASLAGTPSHERRSGMRDPAFLFFAAAAVCATGGMVWGIQMAISGDHLLASAHAHLNLVGWVTLALIGLYYRLTPVANGSLLARVHAVCALSGVCVMVPGIVLVIHGGTPVIAAGGALLSLASMLIFLGTILRHGFGGSPG